MGNKGAYVRFTGKDMEPKIESFEKVDHPKIPPMAYASRFGGLFWIIKFLNIYYIQKHEYIFDLKIILKIL